MDPSKLERAPSMFSKVSGFPISVTMHKKIFQKPLVRLILLYGSLTLLFGLTIPLLFRDDFKQYIIDLGPLGPLAVIAYTVVSHVLAPVTGAPAMIASFVIYGLHKTMLYEFIASMISATIAYFIARHYGRKLIKRLLGPKSMEDIDAFVTKKGIKVLILTRTLGIGIFDIVSYAAGIAKIPFIPYMLITLVTNALLRVIYIILLRDIDFSSIQGVATWFGLLLIIGTVLTFIIRKYLYRGIRTRSS